MLLPGRTYQAGTYAYGFNGKRMDNEMKGIGNTYEFEARIYDSRLGRFLSIDPKANKFPDLSSYNFAANSPIWLVDKNGTEPDRNQAGTIDKAAGQWTKLKNQTISGILEYLQKDPNAVRYVYTQDKGWIDLQHYFGTLKYGKTAMDLLEPASGSKLLQENVFGPGANESYYSYEDLPSNKFASEANNISSWKEDWIANPINGVPMKQLKSEEKTGKELISAVQQNFLEAKAIAPEEAPNWRQIPFKDHGERKRLPEIKSYQQGVMAVGIPGASSFIKKMYPIYYSEEEKKKLLQTGNYVPQNTSSQPYNLNNFPAAPSSLQKQEENKNPTGHN
jgi:RHS repeat-associated protein